MKRIFRSSVVASRLVLAAFLSIVSSAAFAQQSDGPPDQVIVKWRVPTGGRNSIE